MHIAPDRQPRQHLTTRFFTGRTPFLPPANSVKALKAKHQTIITSLFVRCISPGWRRMQRPSTTDRVQLLADSRANNARTPATSSPRRIRYHLTVGSKQGLTSPPGGRKQSRELHVLLLLFIYIFSLIFNDSCQAIAKSTRPLLAKFSWMAELRVSFSIPQGALPWQPIFVGSINRTDRRRWTQAASGV